MLYKQGIGLGVPLTPVMYLTSNCSNCGILFKKECLGHLKAHLFGHWRMYQWWKEGYDFASSCNYMYTYLYFLFYDQCNNFHTILLVATFWILTFQWQCVVPPPPQEGIFLRPFSLWKFQLIFIHFLKFFGLWVPHHQEFSIPSVGGGVWIFSGTTQCNTMHFKGYISCTLLNYLI